MLNIMRGNYSSNIKKKCFKKIALFTLGRDQFSSNSPPQVITDLIKLTIYGEVSYYVSIFGSEITDCFLLHLVQTKLAELRAKSKYRHCNETKLKG